MRRYRCQDKRLHSMEVFSLESESRRYQVWRCGLYCGSIAPVAFYPETHVLAMLWLVSREPYPNDKFSGHPDPWLLFLAKVLRIPLVVFWVGSPPQQKIDQEELKLRDALYSAGFEGDDIRIFRAPTLQHPETLQQLWSFLDELLVPPPREKTPLTYSRSRAVLFLRDHEIGELRPNHQKYLWMLDPSDQTMLNRLSRYATIVEIEGHEALRATQCAVATLDFQTPWTDLPGKHFNFSLTSNALSDAKSFGYMLPE